MKGTPAIAVATVSNGTPPSLSVALARRLAGERQLLVDGAGLVVPEALLALLECGDRALRVAGQAQRLRVLEQRVRARVDISRALAQLDRLLRERERLLGLAGVVELVGLELELRRIVARGAVALLRLLVRLLGLRLGGGGCGRLGGRLGRRLRRRSGLVGRRRLLRGGGCAGLVARRRIVAAAGHQRGGAGGDQQQRGERDQRAGAPAAARAAGRGSGSRRAPGRRRAADHARRVRVGGGRGAARRRRGERVVERAHHRAGALPAIFRLLRHPAREHAVGGLGDVDVELGGARRLVLDVGARLGGEVLGRERLAAGQQLERDDGERVAVRRGRRRLAHRLLGRDVGRGAEHLPRLRDLVLEPEPGNAEIRQREAALLVEQHVGRLDVPMYDAGLVRGVERRAGLGQPAQRDAVGDSAPRCALVTASLVAGAQAVGDGPASDQLHHDERVAVELGDVVDRDHVRVRGEAGGGARLAREAAPGALVLAQVRGEHLYRHRAVEQLVVRLPDARHAAVGYVPHDPIATRQLDASGRLCHLWTVPNAFPRYASRPLWPVSVIRAASAPPSARAARTPWSPRSGVLTRTCRRSASRTRALPSASTSAPAASRRARSPRLSRAARWPIRASSASAASSSVRWPSWRHAARRSTTSTCSPSPTATRATTWR